MLGDGSALPFSSVTFSMLGLRKGGLPPPESAAQTTGAGIVLHFNVRIDAMTFNDPLTFGACESRLRHENRAAVDQRAAIADADHAAPRALADQRSQPRFAKHRRENIAVRSRVLVQ